MPGGSDNPNFSDSDETRTQDTEENASQTAASADFEIAERLTAKWRELAGDFPPPSGRSLSDLYSILTKHGFKEQHVENATAILALLIRAQIKSKELDLKSKKIGNQDIVKFKDVLAAAEKALRNPPINVAVRSDKVFVEKKLPHKNIKRVSWKDDDLILKDVFEEWNVLIENTRSNLIEIAKYTQIYLSDPQNLDMGGRPDKLRVIVGMIGSLSKMWSDCTGKNPNLSKKNLSFFHFASEICSGPPIHYTTAEIESAVRKIVAQNEERAVQDIIFNIASILEGPPHNVPPDVARAEAANMVAEALAKKKKRRTSPIEEGS